MMKIVASLVILGLCVNVAFGAAPTVSSNSGAFSSSVLNSTAIQVIKGTNTTDSAVWDSSCATCGTSNAPVDAGVYNDATWFGPGATNDTSYIWGIPSSGYSTSTAAGSNPGASTPTLYTISSIRKRTINNTVVGWGNDTTQVSVVGDVPVSLSVTGSLGGAAVGPGYLALITSGYDVSATPNAQVWLTIINGATGSATTTKLTSTSDTFAAAATTSPAVPCTATTYSVGNIWYDIGSQAFYYTYSKRVGTYGTPSANAACTSGTATTYANTVNLGGAYLNGTAVWTTPISVSAATAANSVSSLIGGGDNWLNATNIVIIYKDNTANAVYKSTTSKSASTSAVGAFSSLIADPAQTGTTTTVDMTYTPISVWASNFTYGITLANTTTTTVTSPASTTETYTYVNFINGSTTGVDSGLSSSGAYNYAGYAGWQLNTGYSVVASWLTGTSSPYPQTYTLATYYANGTVNQTAATIGSISRAAGAQFYQDVNGTMWIGWTDVDYANNDYTYNAYLAKFQGQLNVPTGAAILSAISAFFAFFLAAVFVF